MSMREREGLIARIRQIRRAAAIPVPPAKAEPDIDPTGIHALELRMQHVEKLVQALQDSVHRESERQSRRIADLEAQIQPSALSIALSKDARERGL
jgi:hypothetical protein